MDANQIAAEITAKYAKLEVEVVRRGRQIQVYGFSKLGVQAAEARQELEAMGFRLSTNGGLLEVEELGLGTFVGTAAEWEEAAKQ